RSVRRRPGRVPRHLYRARRTHPGGRGAHRQRVREWKSALTRACWWCSAIPSPIRFPPSCTTRRSVRSGWMPCTWPCPRRPPRSPACWRCCPRWAGGAARAVAVAAATAKADLHVVSRDAARARGFTDWARGSGARAEPARGALQPDVAINATPLGLKEADPLPLDPERARRLAAALDLVHAPWCARCGQPEPLFGRCRVCADWPAALVRARSAVWLDAGARDAVHALKYGGLPRIAADLASAMASLDLPGRGAAWLVPVPLGPGRLRERGYNQSERLARALSRRWNRPVVELLARTRDTVTQTALTPEARLANVAGAFETRN